MFRHKKLNGVVQVPLRFLFSLLAIIVMVSAAGMTSPVGAVAGYRIVNTINPVHSYNQPNPTSGIFGSLPRGTAINITCQTTGAVTTYRGRGDNVWDLLSVGGWISDAYASTPNFNAFSPGIPRCGLATQPPAEIIPTSVLIRALSRVASQVGQTYQPDGVTPWACWCDHFVAYAYGRGVSGFHTAFEQYNNLLGRGLVHQGDTNAPGGSLVFYNISGAAGHVAFSLGDGTIITTPYNPKCLAVGVVYRTTLDHFANYLGWSPPPPEWLATA